MPWEIILSPAGGKAIPMLARGSKGYLVSWIGVITETGGTALEKNYALAKTGILQPRLAIASITYEDAEGIFTSNTV
jgi:hypothetical protein